MINTYIYCSDVCPGCTEAYKKMSPNESLSLLQNTACKDGCKFMKKFAAAQKSMMVS